MRIHVPLLASLAVFGCATAAATITPWSVSVGRDPGQMMLAGPIAMLPSGDLLIGDRPVSGRIQRFSGSGVFRGVFADDISVDGLGVDDIVPVSDGTWVAGLQIRKYGSDGSVLYEGMPGMRHLARAANGNLLGYYDCKIYEWTETTPPVEVRRWGSCGSAPGQFGVRMTNQFLGLDGAPDGSILVGDSANGRVMRFSATGSYLGTLNPPIPFSRDNTYLDVATDDAGGVYVSDGQRIQEFGPDGHFSSSATLRSDFGLSRLLVVGPKRVIVTTARHQPSAESVQVVSTAPAASFVCRSSPTLTGETVTFDASASSSPFSTGTTYVWDLDGDGAFEVNGGADPQTQVTYSTAGERTASVRVFSSTGEASTASCKLSVRKSPPAGEPGVTINRGSRYTNNRKVALAVVWPPFATQARISNDGGFLSEMTVIRDLEPGYDWQLDDSVKALYTKVVYVRFSGSGIDQTKTYTDDIVLDLTPPTIKSASATRLAGSAENAKRKGQPVRIRTKAKDNRSGVGVMQVTSTKTKPGKELAFARSRTVRVTGKRFFLRVQDHAGNWSKWRTVRVGR